MKTKQLVTKLMICGTVLEVPFLLEAAERLKELEKELEEERYRHDRYVDFEMAEHRELEALKEAVEKQSGVVQGE